MVDVLSPDAGGQPVARVVGQRDGLGWRAERHRHQHRPEHLDLCQLTRRTDARHQRWRVEPAVDRTRVRRLPHLGAGSPPGLDQHGDPLELTRRDDRADVDRLVQRITDTQLCHARGHSGEERSLDGFLDQQPRACAAHLTLVEPDRVHQSFHGAVQVGIVEDDKG